MNLPKFLTTVTPVSKILALMLFITLPILGFFLGMAYQKTKSSETEIDTTLSTPALIGQAFENGKITDEQRLLYLTYAVYEGESLPSQYRSDTGWHGTFIVAEIKEAASNPNTFCTFSSFGQNELKRLLETKVECVGFETAGWKTYANSTHNIIFQYPNDYQVLSAEKLPGQLTESIPYTIFSIEKNQTFPHSQLTTRHIFLLEYIPNVTTSEDCFVSSFNSTPLTHTKNINGQQFSYNDPFGGVAAGTHDTTVNYTTFYQNRCYQINLTFIESSDWNNPKDFDLANKDKESAFSEFDHILATFRFVGE